MLTPKLATALTALTALAAAGLAGSAPAQAATTIGSDLSANPNVRCAAVCTAVGMGQNTSEAPHDLIAPHDGVVVRFRIKHGVVSAPGASYSFKVVSGTGSIPGDPATFTFVRGTGAAAFNTAAGIDTRPVRLPISSLQRIAVSVSDGTPTDTSDDVAFQASRVGYSLGERDGDHTSGSEEYTHHTGYELLVNADIEPDADRDGYGDETQDGCTSAAGPGACPATNTGGGTIPEQLVTNMIPADWVRPRVGKLVRVRQPLSSLSRRGLSLPFACYGPCSAQGALVMSNIAGAILRRYGFSSKSVVVGRGRKRTAKGGKARLKVKLSPRGRKLLRALTRRKRKLTLRTTVSDAWGKSSRRHKIIVTR